MVNLQACNRQTAPTAPPLPSTQLVAAPRGGEGGGGGATSIPESINHLSLKLFFCSLDLVYHNKHMNIIIINDLENGYNRHVYMYSSNSTKLLTWLQ